MHGIYAATAVALAALALGGCSTWRCRGFINVREKPAERPNGNYVIDTVRFVDLPIDSEKAESYQQLIRLSHEDSSPHASYREDLAKFTGFTNEVAGAVSLHVTIAPAPQTSSGWKTVFWPLCGTLGVMPAHFSEQMPFEVSVDFGADVSRSVQAMVCVDRQCGLSRYDMDMPPLVSGTSAEIRDDGTVGTGCELRGVRQREVFVRTVAEAVLQVIAEREKATLVPVPTPYTEFGPVIFPEPIKARVLPAKPKPVVVPQDPSPEEVAREKAQKEAAEEARKRSEAEAAVRRAQQEKDDAFAYPRDAEEKKLKALVLSGFLEKDAWWRRVKEYRAKSGGK